MRNVEITLRRKRKVEPAREAAPDQESPARSRLRGRRRPAGATALPVADSRTLRSPLTGEVVGGWGPVASPTPPAPPAPVLVPTAPEPPLAAGDASAVPVRPGAQAWYPLTESQLRSAAARPAAGTPGALPAPVAPAIESTPAPAPAPATVAPAITTTTPAAPEVLTPQPEPVAPTSAPVPEPPPLATVYASSSPLNLEQALALREALATAELRQSQGVPPATPQPASLAVPSTTPLAGRAAPAVTPAPAASSLFTAAPRIASPVPTAPAVPAVPAVPVMPPATAALASTPVPVPVVPNVPAPVAVVAPPAPVMPLVAPVAAAAPAPRLPDTLGGEFAGEYTVRLGFRDGSESDLAPDAGGERMLVIATELARDVAIARRSQAGRAAADN